LGGHANFDQPWHGGVGQHVNDLVGVDGHGVQQNGWTASHAAKHTALIKGKSITQIDFLCIYFYLILAMEGYGRNHTTAIVKLSKRI
jgi:hypothetical protein